VLPRQIRTRRGWTPGAIITLVACRPDLQNQGYGGATVRDALAWMAGQGLAVAILYGHRNYYPRFGFVPVLPHSETVIGAAPTGSPLLQKATEADLPWMTALYMEQVATAPCAVARTAEPWLWALRNPDRFALWTLPDHTGYAFTQAGTRLGVHEAAAATPAAARRLLAGLRAEAAGCEVPEVKLFVPPPSPVAAAARSEGAETTEKPAGPGMACVTDWAPLLPEGYAIPAEADRTELTQILLGYKAAPGLERDFPRWSLAPFWHG
jgi:hypothetical protein